MQGAKYINGFCLTVFELGHGDGHEHILHHLVKLATIEPRIFSAGVGEASLKESLPQYPQMPNQSCIIGGLPAMLHLKQLPSARIPQNSYVISA